MTKEPTHTQPPRVYQAISAVMGELSKSGISKDQKNTTQGYKFRGIDDVYNALAPLLSQHNLLILPRTISRTPTERQTQKGGVLFHVVLEMEFDFVSAIDGSKHVVSVIGEAMDSADKATNKAMSAAYKYACIEAFCIPTEGDNDADGTTHEVKPEPKPVDDNELNYLLDKISEASSAGEYQEARNMALTARPRMNKAQQLRVADAIKARSIDFPQQQTNGVAHAA